LTTEEPPREEEEPTSLPGEGTEAETDEPVNGVSSAEPPREAAASDASAGEAQAPKRSRILRYSYWGLWFVLLPIVMACVLVWALTPPSGAEVPGVFGWIQSVVRAQPVPVGIVLFTVFEIALWGARHQLPFAHHAHAPVRPDLPQNLRGPFERARVLLDEADTILGRNEKAVAREVSSKERAQLRAALDRLRETMEQVPFEPREFTEALSKADQQIEARLGRWRKSEVREYVEAILMAVAVAFALRAFVIEAFKIPSGSMIPTLMVGDHIFVNKFSYGPAIPYTKSRVWQNMPPHRADVMVFAFPEHPDQDFIKRVIALPGDKLEAKNGHPIINNWEVPSCRVGAWSYSDYESPITRHEGDLYIEYLGDESYLTFYDHSTGMFPEYQGPYFAKPGEVWVMGDNRNNSHDSRMWFGGQGGGVPYENIRGRALFVWLSVSDNGIDWSREFAPVMGRPRVPPSAKALEPALEQCLRSRPAVANPPKP
jgi:signal peptidase I